MGFQTSYVVGGEIDKVRLVKKITNFAQLAQPYNKMVAFEIPAIGGVYEMTYTSPNVDAELIALVVTCSGYGEDDYYNLYVNDLVWFDTWYPTEVKEGLYIGTSTYVQVLEPETTFKLEFHNVSCTSKKVWLGIRMLVDEGFDITESTGEAMQTISTALPVAGTTTDSDNSSQSGELPG